MPSPSPKAAAAERPRAAPGGGATALEIGLNAAIVAVDGTRPLILVTRGAAGEPAGLPLGPFDPLAHRTFEVGLRAFVAAQTALKLGYVEQLYTFGDRGRHARPGDIGPHVVSVGYLALTRFAGSAAGAEARALKEAGAEWRGWYEFFPWEDWRDGRPAVLDAVILPALRRFARAGGRAAVRGVSAEQRLALAFGGDGPFDEERTLDRYELIYEAGLVGEAARDGRPPPEGGLPATPLGLPLRFDHRRILATAISRLRGKMKYRPVVFELLPDEFTLRELQQTVEAIAGRHLHTQNFRRQVEAGELVEPTGRMSGGDKAAADKSPADKRRSGPLGRPAALYRFRREVVRERPAPGLKPGR